MQKFIPVDKLARPDEWVVMRGKQVREIREEQGLEGRPLPFDEETLRARLHGIMTGEYQAMEAAGRTLFDFPDAPWEFQLDMARQVWDESRHVEIFNRLLEYMGGKAGDYVETEILWRCTQAEDPAATSGPGSRRLTHGCLITSRNCCRTRSSSKAASWS